MGFEGQACVEGLIFHRAGEYSIGALPGEGQIIEAGDPRALVEELGDRPQDFGQRIGELLYRLCLRSCGRI